MHITIGSMRRDGTLPEEVLRAAGTAKRVVLQTKIKVVEGFEYTTLDGIYEKSEDFDELTEKACDYLLEDGTMFITLGDACQNNIAAALAFKTVSLGGTVDIITIGSQAASIALGGGFIKEACGITTYTAGCFDAVTNTDNILVIDEIDTRSQASELKLKLSRYYDDEQEMLFVDTRNGSFLKIALFELDAMPQYGYFSSIVIPPVKLEEKVRYTFQDLINVMDKLRGRNGCPWDKEQTHESLKRYLVEESYEVLEAIDEQDICALYDELGDVMLQVVFHAKIAQQHSEFDISDVTTAICSKMISRHTHIFGSAVAHTPGDVIKNWEVIKKEEKSHQTQAEVLKSVPRSMPALLRSEKVQHKAAHVGFDFKEALEALYKFKEEIAELEQDIKNGKDPGEEYGDVLFSAVNVARLLGIEPETALQSATDKFVKRFTQVETLAVQRGIDMKSSSLKELDDLWGEAKKTVD